MRLRLLFSLLCLASISVAGASVAHATPTTIDFDSAAANAPGMFSGMAASPVTIGGVTFSGGVLLNNEMNSVDMSGVYATRFGMSGYSNPITITFSSPVSDLSLLITNNLAGLFTVTSNTGEMVTSSLGYLSPQTLQLTGSGITSVQISQASDLFDFAIDDVTFNTNVAATPEPSSLVLLGTGLLGTAGVLRRRNRIA